MEFFDLQLDLEDILGYDLQNILVDSLVLLYFYKGVYLRFEGGEEEEDEIGVEEVILEMRRYVNWLYQVVRRYRYILQKMELDLKFFMF